MSQKLDKVNNSKCELLSDEGAGLDCQILPQFKWLKYGLNFDDIWVIYICEIYAKFDICIARYMIEIVPM